MFLRLFSRRPWDLGSLQAPWNGRPSIHGAVVEQRRAAGTGPSRVGEDLPDEAVVSAGAELRFAAGAKDSVLSHETGAEALDIASDVHEALMALAEDTTDRIAMTLYERLTRHAALDYFDALLDGVSRDHPRADRLRAIARWLATEAADREPVKFGIGILGVLSDGSDRELFLTLGRHDEFTMFAAAALQATEDEPEPAIWELAQHTTGWGRIHAILRLTETRDPRIGAWLLREGSRNDVMDEYTAYACARAGGLLAALRQPDPDAALLDGAARILRALIGGGPAEDIATYDEGAEAAEHYVAHVRQRRDAPPRHLVAVAEIGDYAAEQSAAGDEAVAGWPDRAASIQAHVAAVRGRDTWRSAIDAGLASGDERLHAEACEAARRLGIDIWDVLFDGLQRGEDRWFGVMQTADPERIAQVVSLAEGRLPLDRIASGPSDTLGIGSEYEPHRALDWILQDLRRFPGLGWPLIRAGLRSPVTRNRYMAAQALAAWERGAWPHDAALLVRHAARAEPREDTRAAMHALIEGRPLP
jgi:hypothetical protein